MVPCTTTQPNAWLQSRQNSPIAFQVVPLRYPTHFRTHLQKGLQAIRYVDHFLLAGLAWTRKGLLGLLGLRPHTQLASSLLPGVLVAVFQECLSFLEFLSQEWHSFIEFLSQEFVSFLPSPFQGWPFRPGLSISRRGRKPLHHYH